MDDGGRVEKTSVFVPKFDSIHTSFLKPKNFLLFQKIIVLLHKIIFSIV